MVTAGRPLPTGRQAFGLELKCCINFLRPAFAGAASRRQASNQTVRRYGHRYPYRETNPFIFHIVEE
jgi:hypothetical protein